MTRDVLLTISGMQIAIEDTDSDDKIEVMTTASYYKRNGKHYVLYEELQEDSQVVKNKIKFSPEAVEVHKSGAVNTNLLFTPNKKSAAYYETPFGTFSMGISANEIHMKEERERIHLNMDYILDVNYVPLASCTLNMDIVPIGRNQEA